MTRLTPLVRRHVVRLFPPEEQAEVFLLLEKDCGEALARPSTAPAETFERVQCAALKLSAGNVDKLYDAIALAQTDWRDLLVAAGFADRTDAHENWES